LYIELVRQVSSGSLEFTGVLTWRGEECQISALVYVCLIKYIIKPRKYVYLPWFENIQKCTAPPPPFKKAEHTTYVYNAFLKLETGCGNKYYTNMSFSWILKCCFMPSNFINLVNQGCCELETKLSGGSRGTDGVHGSQSRIVD